MATIILSPYAKPAPPWAAAPGWLDAVMGRALSGQLIWLSSDR